MSKSVEQKLDQLLTFLQDKPKPTKRYKPRFNRLQQLQLKKRLTVNL